MADGTKGKGSRLPAKASSARQGGATVQNDGSRGNSPPRKPNTGPKGGRPKAGDELTVDRVLMIDAYMRLRGNQAAVARVTGLSESTIGRMLELLTVRAEIDRRTQELLRLSEEQQEAAHAEAWEVMTGLLHHQAWQAQFNSAKYILGFGDPHAVADKPAPAMPALDAKIVALLEQSSGEDSDG